MGARSLPFFLGCLALAVSTSSAVAGAASSSPNPLAPWATAPAIESTQVASGVTYRRVVDRAIPRKTFIITVAPTSSATLDVALARKVLPGFQTTGRMVLQHRAIAGVNGDFGFEPGRPGHAFAEDGELKQTTHVGGEGHAFGIGADDAATFIGRPEIRMTVHDTTHPRSFTMRHWNDGPPAAAEVAGFSPAGGTLEMPPPNACSARLMPASEPRWRDLSATGVARSYVVDEVACAASRMTRDGGVVLSSSLTGVGAQQISDLVAGDDVELTWSSGWPGVVDLLGGGPILLRDGVVVPSSACDAYLCLRHPRTGVGIKADGTIVIVVVEGRSEDSSGVTLAKFAAMMKSLGAIDAMNLDGGGSSEMVVRGEVVNQPSDGHERRVSSALLVLPGADPGQQVAPAE